MVREEEEMDRDGVEILWTPAQTDQLAAVLAPIYERFLPDVTREEASRIAKDDAEKAVRLTFNEERG